MGRVWSRADAAFIEPSTLATRLGAARFVLLGEKHDNPDHHRLQAWLLRALLPAGRHATVAFEMLDDDDEAPLAALQAPTPAQLGEAVGWDRSGWPPFTEYAPVFAAALDAGARITPANPPRAILRGAMTEGVGDWPPARLAELGLDHPLPAPALAALTDEIRETHCGHAPPAMVDAMVLAQQLKDAWMAHRLAEAAGAEGGVLIAGNGHVRRDRGVPRALAQRQAAPVVAVALIEVDDARAAPGAYGGRLDPFDYVWFTPRLDDLDPCEVFRAQLEAMQRKASPAQSPAPKP